MIFASAYSGIGGADAGLLGAGWDLAWQCERNHYRRAVLTRRFHVPIAPSLDRMPPDGLTPAGRYPDALYAELPDARIARWWVPLRQAIFARVRAVPCRRWLILECSPVARCDQILRDIIGWGWHFRLVHASMVIAMPDEPEATWDMRHRAYILASPSADVIDATALDGMSAQLVVNGIRPSSPRGSVEWEEESRGFRVGFSCACGQRPCLCDDAARRLAVREATSPFLTHWLAGMLTGQAMPDWRVKGDGTHG